MPAASHVGYEFVPLPSDSSLQREQKVARVGTIELMESSGESAV